MNVVIVILSVLMTVSRKAFSMTVFLNNNPTTIYGNLADNCKGNPAYLINKDQQFSVYGNVVNSPVLADYNENTIAPLLTPSCSFSIGSQMPSVWTITFTVPSCRSWPVGSSLNVWEGNRSDEYQKPPADKSLLFSVPSLKRKIMSCALQMTSTLPSTSLWVSITSSTHPDDLSLFNFTMAITAEGPNINSNLPQTSTNYAPATIAVILAGVVVATIVFRHHCCNNNNNCRGRCVGHAVWPNSHGPQHSSPKDVDEAMNQPPPAYSTINFQAAAGKAKVLVVESYNKDNGNYERFADFNIHVSVISTGITFCSPIQQTPPAGAIIKAEDPPSYCQVVAQSNQQNHQHHLPPVAVVSMTFGVSSRKA